MANWTKDPDAYLDFAFDWSDWLEAGETIATHTLTVSPSGLTLDDDSEAGGTVTFWLDGGTAGVIYLVRCAVVTSAGREDERTQRVRITNR